MKHRGRQGEDNEEVAEMEPHLLSGMSAIVSREGSRNQIGEKISVSLDDDVIKAEERARCVF